MPSEFRRSPDLVAPSAPTGESLGFTAPHHGITLTPTDLPTTIPDTTLPNKLETFISQVREGHPIVSNALDHHPWAYPPLERFGEVAPNDLQSSLRVGDIAGLMIDDINAEALDTGFNPEEKDKIIVAGVVSDVSRGELDSEVLYEVYTSGKRWRDDENAWQWDVVRGHPDETARIIEDAGGDPDITKMAGGHHSLKRVEPYGTPVNPEDVLVQRGTAIIAAADVADAVSRKFGSGEGRGYLDDKEFVGRELARIVSDELIVDPQIAELAAKNTLFVKGYGVEPPQT